MNSVAKIGAALVAIGCLVAPAAFWFSQWLVYAGVAIAIAGFVLLLWSRHRAGTAEAIGTGGPIVPGSIDAPD